MNQSHPASHHTPEVIEPRAIWLALLLAGVTFVLFAPAIRYEYLVYDDGVYVYGNQDVLKGLTLSGVHYAFTSIAGGSWMPLTWLSHMADVTMFGPSPMGPHAMNILLHSAGAAILLLALQRLTGRLWASVFAAALFAFHPLRNESVAWIAERKDVLSTLFWMLGLLAYVRYVEKPGWKRSLTVALCLVLGLMAKPMLVTFPFVLLLLDFWPLNRLGGDRTAFLKNLWPRIREKFLLFVIVSLVCVATYRAQNRYGAVAHDDVSLGEQLCRVVSNFGFYAQKILWPTGLTVIHPAQSPPKTEAILVGILFAIVTAFVGWRGFRQPWLAVGWFWFLGTLVPVIGIVRIGHISVAERYAYIPSVGLIVLFTWSIAELLRNRSQWRQFSAPVGAAAILACLFVTRADLPRWKDSVALFESAVAVAPHAVAYNNIGVSHIDRRDYARAIEPLTRALELDPRYVKAYLNRALAYQKTGRGEDAKRDYEQLVKIEPRNAEGYSSRADLFMDLSRLDDAISDFTSAIRLSPNSAHTYNNRASALLMKGDLTAALQDCTKAIELNPIYANAYNTRANAYNRMGDLTGALADYNRAIELAPHDSLTYNNRAAVFLALKQYDHAWADVQRCRQLGGTPHEGLVRALLEASTPSKLQSPPQAATATN